MRLQKMLITSLMFMKEVKIFKKEKAKKNAEKDPAK